MGRLLDFSERIILILLFAAFANAILRNPHSIGLLLVATEAMSVFFVIFRKRTTDVSTIPADWFFALAGTMLPLLVRPGDLQLIPGPASATLMVMGALVSIAAKLSLNKRFGLAPANRGVQGGWAYSIVRHPMYAGYFLVQLGFVLANASVWNIGLYLLAWGAQVARMLREEKWLMTDASYRDYSAKVRHRIIPGVF